MKRVLKQGLRQTWGPILGAQKGWLLAQLGHALGHVHGQPSRFVPYFPYFPYFPYYSDVPYVLFERFEYPSKFYWQSFEIADSAPPTTAWGRVPPSSPCPLRPVACLLHQRRSLARALFQIELDRWATPCGSCLDRMANSWWRLKNLLSHWLGCQHLPRSLAPKQKGPLGGRCLHWVLS